MKKRLFILALDGVPQSHLKQWLAGGWMPSLQKWLESRGLDLFSLDSVIPPVSSSAWASFMTGAKPHQHGIYSFTERHAATMEWFTPQADRLKSTTLFEHASAHGKRVFVMNVPVTYPPKPLNGISVCGFLHDDVRTGTWPAETGSFLHSRGYRIDCDTSLAKTDMGAFLDDLKRVLEKRIEMMWHFWRREKWDLFMTHIMAPDRLHHFTFEWYEQGHPRIVQLYKSFYGRLDKLIAQIQQDLPGDCALILLSDHGFTTLKQEVYLNRWLWEKGWLRFTRPVPQSLQDVHSQSTAYALYPGRIFINLKGREKNGSVPPSVYEQRRSEISAALLELKNASGLPVIDRVKRSEDVYSGLATPHAEIADLIAFSKPGYDLKGSMWHNRLFDKSVFNGMHSFSNAFCAGEKSVLPEAPTSIDGLARPLCSFLGLPAL